MKKSLQEKLKNNIIDLKYNNFLEDSQNQISENKIQNLSDRIGNNKKKEKISNSKNSRTSFSNLHSNFNRSLQQNAHSLEKFFKNKNSQIPKQNSKKMHFLDFIGISKEKQL